ncbi:MAG: LysR family transcriptional regulator [Alphaproteobacteria bacterium]
MDWDKLRVFHAVADAGSFTHAGDTLSLSQSAVSRQVHALEESLGVMLFHRHARGLILTEQGELLYRSVHDVFHQLAMTEAVLTDSKERPEGPLRITTTVAFGSTWLTRVIKRFIDDYPGIEVSLILADTDLDITMREADCAIRFAMPTRGDLIQRHLRTVRSRLYASPDYLRAHGMPKSLEDLDGHLIVFGDDGPVPTPSINWPLALQLHDHGLRPVLKVNNIYGIYRAVVSGLGIASLPSYMARLSPELVHVLPDLVGPEIDMYFVYPEELRDSMRISMFRDFLVRSLNEAWAAPPVREKAQDSVAAKNRS